MVQKEVARHRPVTPPVLLVFFLLSLSISGCISLRDPEASFDYTGDVVATIQGDQPLLQTFKVRRPGLNGLQLWLRKASGDANDKDLLKISIYLPEKESQPLVNVQIPYSSFKDNFPYELRFAPLEDPAYQVYTLRLEALGGPVAVYGRGEDVYPDGSLYFGGIEQNSDLGFRTSYEYGYQAFIDDLRSTFVRSWLIIPLLLLLWLPGSVIIEALSFWFSRKDHQNHVNRKSQSGFKSISAAATLGLGNQDKSHHRTELMRSADISALDDNNRTAGHWSLDLGVCNQHGSSLEHLALSAMETS